MKTKAFYLHHSIGFLVDCKDNKVGHTPSHQKLSLPKKSKTVASLATKAPPVRTDPKMNKMPSRHYTQINRNISLKPSHLANQKIVVELAGERTVPQDTPLLQNLLHEFSHEITQ